MIKGTFERAIPASNKIIQYREKCRQARIHNLKLQRIASQNRTPQLFHPTFRKTFFNPFPKNYTYRIQTENKQLLHKIKSVKSQKRRATLPKQKKKQFLLSPFQNQQRQYIIAENKKFYQRLIQAKPFCSIQKFKQLENKRSKYLNNISRFEKSGMIPTKTKIPIFYTQIQQKPKKMFLLHQEEKEIDGRQAVVKVIQDSEQLSFQLQMQDDKYSLQFSIKDSCYLLEQVFNESIASMVENIVLLKGKLYLQIPHQL